MTIVDEPASRPRVVEVTHAKLCGEWYAHCGICDVTRALDDPVLYAFRRTSDQARRDAERHRDRNHPGFLVVVEPKT